VFDNSREHGLDVVDAGQEAPRPRRINPDDDLALVVLDADCPLGP